MTFYVKYDKVNLKMYKSLANQVFFINLCFDLLFFHIYKKNYVIKSPKICYLNIIKITKKTTKKVPKTYQSLSCCRPKRKKSNSMVINDAKPLRG